MESHLPPMVLYAMLALAVAVTAKATEQVVSKGTLFRGRRWLMRLVHVPVLLAWLHLGIFLIRELVVTKASVDWFGYASLVVHAVVLAFVGLVCVLTYHSQFRQWRLGSVPP